jgi:general secretion pathway protein G
MKTRIFRSVRRGFTLIELMVVILILAILASIVVPRVVNRASDAKVTKAKSDINTLSQSLNQFRLDNDRYPSTEEGLQALRLQPADTNNWKGPYIEKDVPLDPWGNAYIYEFPGTAGPDSFTLMTYGSDGAPGGEGESADISEADL